MTTQSTFTHDEWTLLVRVPRWVVGAASAAQPDNEAKTRKEIEAGFIAIAEGRSMGNVFVREVAQACMDFFDTTVARKEITFTEPEPGLATVLERVTAVSALLNARVAPVDAAAYRQWIVGIVEVVINAVRSGGHFGFGGVQVTKAEKAFRDQVVRALQS